MKTKTTNKLVVSTKKKRKNRASDRDSFMPKQPRTFESRETQSLKEAHSLLASGSGWELDQVGLSNDGGWIPNGMAILIRNNPRSPNVRVPRTFEETLQIIIRRLNSYVSAVRFDECGLSPDPDGKVLSHEELQEEEHRLCEMEQRRLSARKDDGDYVR